MILLQILVFIAFTIFFHVMAESILKGDNTTALVSLILTVGVGFVLIAYLGVMLSPNINIGLVLILTVIMHGLYFFGDIMQKFEDDLSHDWFNAFGIFTSVGIFFCLV